MTTREALERYVAEWLPRLGLTHWKIEVDWSRPAGDEATAEVDREETYDAGTMRFSAKYPSWEPEWAEWTVVHELVHLVTRDLEMAVAATHETLPPVARLLADKRFEHEIEGVVDRLAAVLVAVARSEKSGPRR